MNMPTQQVAEALREAMPKAAWVNLSHNDYRVLARAAIDALQLTEQWFIPTFLDRGGNPRGGHTYDNLKTAQQYCDDFPEAVIYTGLYVGLGPWVEGEQ